jgi:hypothetical protein
MNNFNEALASAVSHFWSTRDQQSSKQKQTGKRDQGSRGAVTGGAQMDGFVKLVSELLIENGLSQSTIFLKKQGVLPGFFRATKEWDLAIVSQGHLVATIEFKSHVGSFGNNFNNRSEEAIGNATDLWTAYRDGAFEPSSRPWLGYLILLEDSIKSTCPVIPKEKHFSVFQEFKNASYEKRYELLCLKLVRERLYDAACFIMSARDEGLEGKYREPSPELAFSNFAASLSAKIIGHVKSSIR